MDEEKPKPTEEKKDDFRYLVRIANADLDGNKAIFYALSKVKGISHSFANAVCRMANVDVSKKVGYLTDAEVANLDKVIANPSQFKVPSWIFNRKKDIETGEDKHLITGDLQFAVENDIKIMKKIKCYKGMRHAFNLPVRGQRTKSNFRKSKSRGKGGIGVAKSKARSKK